MTRENQPGGAWHRVSAGDKTNRLLDWVRPAGAMATTTAGDKFIAGAAELMNGACEAGFTLQQSLVCEQGIVLQHCIICIGVIAAGQSVA